MAREGISSVGKLFFLGIATASSSLELLTKISYRRPHVSSLTFGAFGCAGALSLFPGCAAMTSCIRFRSLASELSGGSAFSS